MEGFPFQGNVCSQIIGINLGNLVERQPTHLRGEKIDVFCNVGQAWGEGELVCCSLQQPLQ
jgi:hypothetical protein